MRPNMDTMTLREKIGQTGIPSPRETRISVPKYGGFEEYFTCYPFCGLYMTYIVDKDDNEFSSPESMAQTLHEANKKLKIPLLITTDAEFGGKTIFPQLHRICSNMSVGAACDGELAYKRAFYWAKEMRSCGVNWVFGPVIDLHKNFFSPSATRCFSSDYQIAQKMIPHIIKGIHDAGLGSCAKHYPGGSTDYRDAHYSAVVNNVTLDDWHATNARLYKTASEAGAMAVMVDHTAVPAMDDSFAREGVPRPASASKKALDILRRDIGFEGLILTDAVAMKCLAAAFEHDDIYIECLNAGNDIVLFCHNDYIDVIEKAVQDGRVSIERINEACRHVLDLKEKLGLFDEISMPVPLTEEEIADFEQVNYEIAKKALTLVCNRDNVIPFDPVKVKNIAIIKLAPSEKFHKDLEYMIDSFTQRGCNVTLLDGLKNKSQLQMLAQNNDIIIYACYMAMSEPSGMHFFSNEKDLCTLINSLSYGAAKSVVASFGTPSIYYNYFESATCYINAYSSDPGTMRAFVDGILGDFEFTGESPVPLVPEF